MNRNISKDMATSTTSLSKLGASSAKNNSADDTYWLALAYCILALSLYFLSAPYHRLLSEFAGIEMESEYTLFEQASKYYLFLIMLVSVIAYNLSTDNSKIMLSISFLMLALVMYLSECNMITEITQPVFGLVGIVATGFLLIKSRSWLSLTAFIAGFTFITFGSLADHISESTALAGLLPEFVFQLISPANEEIYELAGIVLFCLSAILCFRVQLHCVFQRSARWCVLLLAASFLVAAGNGFLHHVHHPHWKHHLAALVITLIGFIGLVISCKQINKPGTVFALPSEGHFYLFLFFTFVVLQSLHGDTRSTTVILVWIPAFIFFIAYLWQHRKLMDEKASQ